MTKSSVRIINDRSLASSNATFMSKVYLWMSIGIGLTGLIAYLLGTSQAMPHYMQTNPQQFKNLMIAAMVAQLVAVLSLSFLAQRLNALMTTGLYLLYASLTGVTFALIFFVYTGQSIASTFFLTSFAFAGLCSFGFVTKRDLGPVGSFCMIGLYGMIGVMLLGFFVPSLMSSGVQFATSVIGVLVFAGLTAYDTQKIKNMNVAGSDVSAMQKQVVFGALVLYLDFINLFMSLLRLFGQRRD